MERRRNFDPATLHKQSPKENVVKLLQIMFIAVLGGLSFATCLTSETLHQPSEVSEQEIVIPAPIRF